MGLVARRIATAASLASASLCMVGSVPGTFHHLYFSGTTTPVMAVGAAFSALEVVPLIVLGYEAWEHWSYKDRAPWMQRVKWLLMCFVAVAFWNRSAAHTSELPSLMRSSYAVLCLKQNKHNNRQSDNYTPIYTEH